MVKITAFKKDGLTFEVETVNKIFIYKVNSLKEMVHEIASNLTLEIKAIGWFKPDDNIFLDESLHIWQILNNKILKENLTEKEIEVQLIGMQS